MPKIGKVIQEFDGGINTFSDARDLDDKTASEITNFSVRNVGKLKALGYFTPVGDAADTYTSGDLISIISSDEEASGMLFDGGAVFTPYSTDTDRAGTAGAPEKWIAFVDKTTGRLWLHSKTDLVAGNNPWWHPDPSLGSGTAQQSAPFAYGLPAVLTASMTEEASYYAVDGALRVCDTNYAHANAESASGSTKLWFGYISRTYYSDGVTNGCNPNGWFTYPVKVAPPNTTTFNTTVTTLNSQNTGPDLDAGQFGINIQIARDKGDGTLQLQGRKLYVSYTFDARQESLPLEFHIIDTGQINEYSGAPVPTDLGYITTVSANADFNSTTLGLVANVTDNLTPNDLFSDEEGALPWELTGNVTVQDDRGEYQTLTYTGIDDATDGTYGNYTSATNCGSILTGVGGWVDHGVCDEAKVSHSTKALCDSENGGIEEHAVNQGGDHWSDSSISAAASIEFDPPGELEEMDQNLGFKISLSAHVLDAGTNGQIIAPEYGGNRVTHVNFYTNKYKDDLGLIAQEEDFQYVCSFDLVNGFVNNDGTFTGWETDDTHADQQITFSGFFGSGFADTYQGRTGVFPVAVIEANATATSALDIRWKTATILNRRVYAGNVWMKDVDGTDKGFPDRIMKSIPNRFDIFPDYDSLDVVVDDGDEIVLLESFGGQLLQFKKETLYVIDVTAEPEFLRETLKYRGIPTKAAAMRTDYGVIFGNKSGAFLYDGEQAKQLTAGKLEDEWESFYADDLVVGFHPRYNIGIFAKSASPDFLIYDLLTKSWIKGVGLTGGASDGYRIGSFQKSRFIPYENELILAQEGNDDHVITFSRWVNDFSTVTTAQESAYEWKSKDLTLGSPATIKRVSIVRITYKTTSGAAGNAKATLYHKNGLVVGSTALSSAGTDFGDTTGEWFSQDFIPATPIKCMSVQIKIENDGILDKGFEINDITIIYRERPIK